jgi:hypothetical protein
LVGQVDGDGFKLKFQILLASLALNLHACLLMERIGVKKVCLTHHFRIGWLIINSLNSLKLFAKTGECRQIECRPVS